MSKVKKGFKNLIVIPTLNNLEYLKGALNTIQMTEPFYLLIIDNGSTDGTRKWLKSLLKTPNLLVLLANENLGAAGSWNAGITIGIEKLKVKNIFILNNDLLLLPKTLDIMLSTLKRKGVGMATAKNVSGEVSGPEEFLKMKIPMTKLELLTPDFSCFCLKKETIQKVGLFDEAFYPAYFEDNDYHYRMEQEGLKALCVHRAIYFHYGSRSRILSPEFKEYLDSRYLANEDYYVKKWGGKPGQEKFRTPFNGKPPSKIEIEKFKDDKHAALKKAVKQSKKRKN